tara:strand:- start:283 stop:486 length:204 start_codon:yes stop_codon:yes gene_type:complete
MTDKLGSAFYNQVSISEKINHDKINNIYLSNITAFEKISSAEKDIYAMELFDYLKKEKKLDFLSKIK